MRNTDNKTLPRKVPFSFFFQTLNVKPRKFHSEILTHKINFNMTGSGTYYLKFNPDPPASGSVSSP